MTDSLAGNLQENAFVVERQVRWGECDPAGIVYTPNFVDYAVDTARMFWRAVAWRDFGSSDGCGLELPAKHLTSTFHAALACDDHFSLRAEIVRVGKSSFDVRVRGSRETKPVFETTITFVSVVGEPRRALALPEAIRTTMARMIQP
jgi:acyl-CoA thioesterase FadM